MTTDATIPRWFTAFVSITTLMLYFAGVWMLAGSINENNTLASAIDALSCVLLLRLFKSFLWRL